MTRLRLRLFAAALALPLGLATVTLIPSAAAAPQEDPPAVPTVATGDVMDTLAADPQFSMLVELLKSSGLDTTLREAGPFTLFAPSNDALEKGDPDRRAAIVADPERLKKMLLGHVVAGQFSASELEESSTVENLAGRALKVKDREGRLFVGNRRVLVADVPATNGVIHVMKEAFLPRAIKNAHEGEAKKKGKGKGKKKGEGKGEPEPAAPPEIEEPA